MPWMRVLLFRNYKHVLAEEAGYSVQCIRPFPTKSYDYARFACPSESNEHCRVRSQYRTDPLAGTHP